MVPRDHLFYHKIQLPHTVHTDTSKFALSNSHRCVLSGWPVLVVLTRPVLNSQELCTPEFWSALCTPEWKNSGV